MLSPAPVHSIVPRVWHLSNRDATKTGSQDVTKCVGKLHSVSA
jgi:hypothetical protein